MPGIPMPWQRDKKVKTRSEQTKKAIFSALSRFPATIAIVWTIPRARPKDLSLLAVTADFGSVKEIIDNAGNFVS